MARANLHVSEELKALFVDSQDRKTRWIKLLIQGEEFKPTETLPPSVSAESDFNQLADQVTADSACLFLFCKDMEATALRWTLIAYVPDTSPVREKMLYSSSREGLKRELGYNYFVGEFQATESSELTYAAFEQSKIKSTADAPLTESERLVKEHSHLERDTNVKSTAMGVVPFTISNDVRSKLEEFNQKSLSWVLMVLNAEAESVDLVDSGPTDDVGALSANLSTENPSYIAYRHREGRSYFVFSCPETAPVRLKMMSSTCKATVLDAAATLNLVFDNLSEIRDVSELHECLTQSLEDRGSPEKPKVFSKPSAPGRGRRGRGGSRVIRPVE